MKKMFSRWMVLACGLCIVLVSCNKDEKNDGPVEPEATLSFNVADVVDFMPDGEMKSVVVTTNQSTWTASMVVAGDTAWCKLSQKADTLKITTLKNSTGILRTGKVKFVAGSGENVKTKEISVNQDIIVIKTYKLFELYNENGVKGIIYELNEEKTGGKMLSLTEMRTDDFITNIDYYKNFTVGATDEEDGMVNMKTIKEKVADWKTEYHVIAWVEEMNVNGVTGWYLPAINEVKKIIAVYDSTDFNKSPGELNAALIAAGGVKMDVPVLTSYKLTSYAPQLAFGSSTTSMDGRYAYFNIIGYNIAEGNPNMVDYKDPRKGEYMRWAYNQRLLYNSNSVYQFRAIRKF